MNSETTMKTPTDILNERDAKRSAGRLAHTPNGRGEFYARVDCLCYTCRDVIDPTGEEDAKVYNNALMASLCKQANLPPPPPSPVLTRQNAICINCEETHCCDTNCDPKKAAAVFLNTFDYAADGIGPTDTVPLPSLRPLSSVSLGPSPTGYCLPPPPPIQRHPSTTSSGDLLSPIVGILTPRSTSEPLSIEDKTYELEMKLQPRLCKLLRTYQKLQEHIEQLQADPSLKHDEMAMYDTWWTEVDHKIATLESLIAQLPE